MHIYPSHFSYPQHNLIYVNRKASYKRAQFSQVMHIFVHNLCITSGSTVHNSAKIPWEVLIHHHFSDVHMCEKVFNFYTHIFRGFSNSRSCTFFSSTQLFRQNIPFPQFFHSIFPPYQRVMHMSLRPRFLFIEFMLIIVYDRRDNLSSFITLYK